MAGKMEQRGEEEEEEQRPRPVVGEEVRGKPSSDGRRSLWMVYVAHALSTWGDNL